MSSTVCSPYCPPRWATPRNPDRPTRGGAQARIAAILGRPFIPWQRDVTATAGEYDPATGRMAYPIVVCIVPRRAGKTIIGQAVLFERSFTGLQRSSWYTAQKREAAAVAWRDDWFPILQRSRLGRLAKLRRSNGSETITFAPGRLDSTVRLFAPGGEALRGQNANLIVVDEAREFSFDAGQALEAAARPAQLVCADRQLWIISSAGTSESTWLADWRDRGRAALAGVAYFEWSAPEDADPADPATWMAAHPGIGWHVPVEAIAADAASMDPVKFACEYLGWWPNADQLEPMPAAAWAAARDTTAAPAGLLSWAVEVAYDRTASAIVAAGCNKDGRVVAELVDYAPGTSWVVDRVNALVTSHGARRVLIDPVSPAGTLIPELERRRVPLWPVDARGLCRACAALRDDVVDGRVRVRPHPALDTAVSGARRRMIGDSWAYARREADSDAGPLVALALAVFDARLDDAPAIT